MLKIHQEPENITGPLSRNVLQNLIFWNFAVLKSSLYKLICINEDLVLPFTGFHDFLDVGEQKMHVGLAESVD